MVSLWGDSWVPEILKRVRELKESTNHMIVIVILYKRLTIVVGATSGLDEGLSVTGRLLGVFVIGRLVGLSVVGLRLGR